MENKCILGDKKDKIAIETIVLLRTISIVYSINTIFFVYHNEKNTEIYSWDNISACFFNSHIEKTKFNIKNYLERVQDYFVMDSFFAVKNKIEVYFKDFQSEIEIEKAFKVIIKSFEMIIEDNKNLKYISHEEKNRRKNLAKIVENEYRYFSLLEGMSESVVIMTEIKNEYIIKDINYSSLIYFNQQREEIIGKNIENVLKIKKSEIESLKNGSDNYFNSIQRWIKGKCYKNKDGIITFIFEDITEKKAKEIVMKRLYVAIEQSEELIIIFDKNLKIEYVNNKFESFTGYFRKEIIGKNIGEIFTNFHKEIIEEIQNKGYWKSERVEKKNLNEYYWESTIITIVYNEKQEIEGYIKISTDITERKKNEEKISFLYKEVEKASMAKSEFLSNMSHEMRTPMNGIIGITELLEEESDINERKELLEILKISSKNMLAIINSMLDITELEYGDFSFVKRKFNLKKFIEKNILNMEMALEGNSEIKFIHNINLKSEIECFSDTRRITQIIKEIFNNAVKYTEKGEIRFEVYAEERINDIEIQFVIEDTGIGINKSEFDKVFDSFYQSDSSYTRKRGGAGIGLTIVKKICKKMNGTIEVNSELGKGSRFLVKIPLEKAHEKININTETVNMKILVAGEDNFGRIIATELIKKSGLHVESVETPLEMLKEVAFGNYKIVFVDLSIQKDGFLRTVKKIREKGEKIPIYAITSGRVFNQKDEIEDSGFSGTILKPIEFDSLKEIIEDEVLQ